MRKPASALVFGIVFALAGCASAKGGAGGSVHRARVNSNSSVIMQQELDRYPSATAYDIVQRLHPQWLQNRNQATLPGNPTTDIQVYLGDSQLGGVDELRNYTGSELASIQYLSAAQAMIRFGVGNSNGAILLKQR